MQAVHIQINDSIDRAVSVDELARRLSVSRRTIWRWVKSGRLPPLHKLNVSLASRAHNAPAVFRASDLVNLKPRAAHRPANAAHGSYSGGTNEKDFDTMQNVSSTTMNTAKYAVNRRTGVFFVAHIDMFHRADPDGNRWSIPHDMEFFTDHDEAKKLSDSILAELTSKDGTKLDPRISTPPLLAPNGDSKKLPSKSEVVRIAKERYGVDIVINRSRKNVDAQSAVNAQALAELDQIPAAA